MANLICHASPWWTLTNSRTGRNCITGPGEKPSVCKLELKLYPDVTTKIIRMASQTMERNATLRPSASHCDIDDDYIKSSRSP